MPFRLRIWTAGALLVVLALYLLLWSQSPQGRRADTETGEVAAPAGPAAALAAGVGDRSPISRPGDAGPWSWAEAMGSLAELEGAAFQTAMERCLARPDLLPWLLEKLEHGRIPAGEIGPLAWLLRSVLLVPWETLEHPQALTRDAFLERVVRAGAAWESSAAVVGIAWRDHRILRPEHRALVVEVRPDDLDQLLQPPEATTRDAGSLLASPTLDAPRLSEALAAGIRPARPRSWLILLEDLLRACLEAGETGYPMACVSDPSPLVRLRALRLLLAHQPELWEQLADLARDLPARCCSALAVQLANDPSVDPHGLAPALARWTRIHRVPFTAAWLALGRRSQAALEETLARALEEADPMEALEGTTGPPGRPPAGRALRSTLIGVLDHLGSQPGHSRPLELLAQILELDPDPQVRQSAWASLLDSPDPASRALALQALDREAGGWRADPHTRSGVETMLPLILPRLGAEDTARIRRSLLLAGWSEEEVATLLQPPPEPGTDSGETEG